ncbi:hypothetical protein AB0M28_17920 [Streptomyces sp. NPDC051940]|uniref:hypothetical protein n=1 Tax=Streptomyces sp. NPDC051940 TaxID=3155675 RepID=UPI00344A4EAA
MSQRRLCALAAVTTAGAIGAVFGLSASAAAVTPATATASFDCGTWGSGSATLTAADSGGVKSIRFDSSAIKIPPDTFVDPNTLTTTARFTKNGGSTPDAVFSGTVNPPMDPGSDVTIGPIPLTSANLSAGDTTNSYTAAWSIRIQPPGGVAAVDCTATSSQSSAFTW